MAGVSAKLTESAADLISNFAKPMPKLTTLRTPPLAVVKLGGSQIRSPQLHQWVAALAAQAGRVVVVTGGGPFADAVRDAQASIGFDDVAAHEMAMVAMGQFARALVGVDDVFRVVESRAAILKALSEGKTPVWSPVRMTLAARLPATWDLTSDGLSAWLAVQLGVEKLILVKHGRFAKTGVALDDLALDGIVDPLFARFVHEGRLKVEIAGPEDAERLAEGLRRPLFPEILTGMTEETPLRPLRP